VALRLPLDQMGLREPHMSVGFLHNLDLLGHFDPFDCHEVHDLLSRLDLLGRLGRLGRLDHPGRPAHHLPALVTKYFAYCESTVTTNVQPHLPLLLQFEPGDY
jgi:hypothetical protein